MLGAPVLWLVYLQTVYALVQPSCNSGVHMRCTSPPRLSSALMLVFAGISFVQWEQVGKGWPSDDEGTRDGRRRAMAMIGLLQSAFFALLIATSWAAIFIIDPCQNLFKP